MSKKTTVSGILLVLLVLATTPLLGTDNVSFLKWWLMTLVLGIGFYPAAAALFPRFHDRGWMFSKVLGIVVSGFAVFALGSFGLVPFTAPVCLITVGVLILASWIFGCFKVRVHAPEIDFLMMEEVLFFAFFLLWTYLAGFHPEAHGTEKFMDYGFMKAMMRSTAVPAEDLWYSGSGINYYYGGQFYAVFLTKITFTDVKQTYHLMRTMVASFAFVLPFSITYHLAESRACHRIRKEGGNKSQIAPVLGGLLSGGAVSLAGNMHYVIYGCIRQWLGLNESAYWFPSSTRYIGYDPLVENDRTIHEFPSYSFVLGDLHAHVVNVMFVLLVLGLLYSYVKNTCGKRVEMVVKRRSASAADHRGGLSDRCVPLVQLLGFCYLFRRDCRLCAVRCAVPVSCAGERDDRNGSPAGCRSFCNWNDCRPSVYNEV